ncbi:MAG: RDD family protein [marine benthic group bacterium]|nr:RDD family protein [Gemmatimonadota bacterium]
MEQAHDPRRTITPDAFSVAPGLLGIPLASPWRRLVAILIDLSLIGLLANARAVFFALAAAAFLFWLAIRGRKDSQASAARRTGLGCLGSTVAFIAVLMIFGPSLVPDDAVLFEADGPGGTPVPVSVGAIGDLLDLVTDSDTVDATAAAERLVDRYRESGMSREEMLALVESIERDSPDNEELAGVLREVVRRTVPASGASDPDAAGGDRADASTEEQPLDRSLRGLASALQSGDSVAVDSLRGPVVAELAAPELEDRQRRIRSLRDQNEELEREIEQMEARLEAEEERGIRRTITNLLDEFGLGLGWSGLYFTFLTAFLRGRTPGKRLLNVRVVRLDGRPLGYWASFERFGGYAASLFTGFEGFLRILWDPNRQGLEDKLAETVVVMDTVETRGQLEKVVVWGPTGAPPQG